MLADTPHRDRLCECIPINSVQIELLEIGSMLFLFFCCLCILCKNK